MRLLNASRSPLGGFCRICALLKGFNVANTIPDVRLGNTNAQGVYQVVLVSNITTTGCTVTVVQRSAVILLAVEVLLASTTPVSGATVGILVVSKT